MKNKKKINQNTINAKQLEIKGLVQGIGFRPYIYRLAIDNNLKGWVKNKTDCVIIHIEGNTENTSDFDQKIKSNPPPSSIIESIKINETKEKGYKTFSILKSKSNTSEITQVSPDLAVCNDCLEDIKNHKNRINYPFTNCTNCGPRFSIIKEIPYDRINTSMNEFEMCPSCMKEYKTPENRRFHAQPNACIECGPQYTLHLGKESIRGFDNILETTASLLLEGKVIALKGIGGFHLICNPYNETSIEKLKNIKHRDKKPFALMFSSIKAVEKETILNEKEKELLTSPKRPIVLLKKRNNNTKSLNNLSPGINTIGIMLPYTPIHYLIFEKTNLDALVYTSGNLADEPIIIDNKQAINIFSGKCDAILSYNRKIINRNDDSVTAVYNNQKIILRRSRGYAPSPIITLLDVDSIFSVGAELKNTFCIGKGNQAILSQHIGNLKNIETLEFYNEAIDRYKRLFKSNPQIIACDLHPDYLSTRFAKESGLSITQVQHHHAHIASCMAEHGLDQKVIGISFDGTGYGDDGKIWGGEIFINDLFTYERIFHFNYIPMPGGEKAINEPWRMGISYLYQTFGNNLLDLKIPFIKKLNKKDLSLILSMIKSKTNCPETSSCGRLFDAISSILELVKISQFEAEAAMKLESAINLQTDESYPFETGKTIDLNQMIKAIVQDIIDEKKTEYISTKFHNTIVSIIIEAAELIRKKFLINDIILSGGVFQNRYVAELSEKKLYEKGFNCYTHLQVPANDGGIALGQLMVAAKRRMKCV